VPTDPSLMSTLMDWRFEPQVALGIVLAGAIYVAGLRDLARRGRLWRTVHRSHVVLFALGLVVLAVALMSPLDTLDTRVFALHMTQHLLLLEAAPILLLLGKPIPVLLLGLPRGLVRALTRAYRHSPSSRRLMTWATAPLTSWVLYVGVIVGWHVPVIYQTTLWNQGVHLLEHLSFLGVALLFWWVALEPWPGARRLHPGVRLFYTASVMVPMSLLGGLFSVSGTLWYPFYATFPPLWGLSPLDDQVWGGIIMWAPGSIAYVAVALALFSRMIEGGEQESPADASVVQRVQPVERL